MTLPTSKIFLAHLVLFMFGTIAMRSIGDAQTNAAQQTVTANYFVASPSDFGTALSTMPSSGGTIVVSSQFTGTLSSQLGVSTPNVSIVCMPGATITSNYSGSFILVTAAATNFRLERCNLGTSSPNNNVVNVQTSGFKILNNIFSAGGVLMQGATAGLIQGNTVASGSIFGQSNTSNVQVVGNNVASPSGSAISFHGTTSGDTVSQLSVTGNHIHAAGTFCVEIGAFGSGTIPPADVLVSDNDCVLSGNAKGGYSMDSVVGPVVSNNSFDANGFNATVAGVEIVDSSHNDADRPAGSGSRAVVKGNFINGAGISVNKQAYNMVEGNTVTFDGTKVTIGLAVTSSVAGTSVDNNQIRNNIFICAPCSSSDKIIWVQNNASGSTIIGTQITGNTFVGSDVLSADGSTDTTTGEVAIQINNDGESSNPNQKVNNTTIFGNYFKNVSTAILPQQNVGTLFIGFNNLENVNRYYPASAPSGSGYSFGW